MDAIINIIPRPDISPLLVTGRDDDVGYYNDLGYSFLIDTNGSSHLVNIYRDVKVLSGSLSRLPRVKRR